MSDLEIIVTEDNDRSIITLNGKLDTNTSPEFEAVAQQLIADGVTHIVVDMSNCDYVSSAGLRVIIALQKQLFTKGSLVFRDVQPEVMEVFDMTSFSKILTFE